MGWGCISLGERSVFAYEPAGPAWGLPVRSPLEGSAPRMLVTASARRGPVRTALGGVTGSHRRPSERAPRTVAPFRRWGARRAVRSRGEGVCPGAAAIDGAPPVCPGPRGARLLCVALVIATATPAAPTPGTRPLLPERPAPPPRVHGADFRPGPVCARCLCCFLSAPRGTHGSPFSGEGAGQGTPPSLSPPSTRGGDGSPCSRFSRGPDVAAPVRPWAGAGCVLSPSHPARPLSAARRWGRGPTEGSGFLSPPVWVQPLSFRLLSLSASPWGVLPLHGPCPSSWPGPLCHLGVTS